MQPTNVSSHQGSTTSDEEMLRTILRRVRSPMWWARLGYPEDPKFWTEEEREVLNRAFSRA